MNYRIDHIPKSTAKNRRPGLSMEPQTITIHNTGNPSSTARNERGWLTNSSNVRTASYHIVVDEKEAVECLPLNENSWHAGDGYNGPGNRTSISVEICESGDREKTLDNAVELVAKLLKERGWGVDRLRRHYDWTGKICPRLMYDGGTWVGWRDFVERVSERIKPPSMHEANFVINGKEIDPGVLIDGRTYAPVRALLTELGISFRWDGKTRTVYIDK